MAVVWPLDTSLAQQFDMRGTTAENAKAAKPSAKKKKNSKAKLAEQGEPEAKSVQSVPVATDEAVAGDPANADADATALMATINPADTGADLATSDSDLPDVAPDATGSVAMQREFLETEVPSPVSRQKSDGALERDGIGPLGRENEKVASIEGKDKSADADPFAAPGIRKGSFLLRPTLESGLRYSNNPDDPTCDCFANRAETTITMRAQSDWLRNSLNFELRGTGHRSLSNPTGSELAPSSDTGIHLGVDGRLDVSVADTATFSASLDRAREVLSQGATTGYVSRPIQTTLSGEAGFKHEAGVVGISLNGKIVRNTYGDSIDLSEVTQSQSDRDNTFASATLRGTYDTRALFAPFAEIEIGRRVYDNKFDSGGTQRSANRYAGRAGVAFNRSEKLSGELAAGWFVENPDDETLNNISGIDLRGSVNWSPVRDTTVKLNASTAVEGASSTTSESSVAYLVSADFTRKLRANLDGNLALSANVRDYTGVLATQTTLTAEAGATWWFNRYAGLNGKLTYSHTNGVGSGSRNTTGAYIGVILRR